MNHTTVLRGVCGSLALVLGLCGQALAQEPSEALLEPTRQHPEAEDAIDKLKSPYCPGLMLEVCTSLGGALLRDSLQVMAAEGWTSDELVDWVLENHGDTLLALPRAEGRSLVAWVMPPAVFLLGLTGVVVALRAMRRKAGPDELEGVALSADEEARLGEALRELDEEEEPVF
jgi:cytochrome c-type biogenesis protein CcmH/NrfF